MKKLENYEKEYKRIEQERDKYKQELGQFTNCNVAQLMKENDDLQNKSQMKGRQIEMNLEETLKREMENKLQGTNIKYNHRSVNSRKREEFIIQRDYNLLYNNLPKMIIGEYDLKFDTIKLTQEEIEELQNQNEIVLKNRGSQISHLLGYDVCIKYAIDEDDEESVEEFKPVRQIKQQKKQIQKKEERKPIQQDIRIQQTINVTMEDVWRGNSQTIINYEGNQYPVDIPGYINDGDVETKIIGVTNQGQNIHCEIRYVVVNEQEGVYRRNGNDLWIDYTFSINYYNQSVYANVYDEQVVVTLNDQQQYKPFAQKGFMDKYGRRGNLYIRITLE